MSEAVRRPENFIPFHDVEKAKALLTGLSNEDLQTLITSMGRDIDKIDSDVATVLRRFEAEDIYNLALSESDQRTFG